MGLQVESDLTPMGQYGLDWCVGFRPKSGLKFVPRAFVLGSAATWPLHFLWPSITSWGPSQTGGAHFRPLRTSRLLIPIGRAPPVAKPRTKEGRTPSTVEGKGGDRFQATTASSWQPWALCLLTWLPFLPKPHLPPTSFCSTNTHLLSCDPVHKAVPAPARTGLRLPWALVFVCPPPCQAEDTQKYLLGPDGRLANAGVIIQPASCWLFPSNTVLSQNSLTMKNHIRYFTPGVLRSPCDHV